MTARCTLIIDSCSDLPREVVDRSGVFLLEFPYVMGGKGMTDDLYANTTPHEFYEHMRGKNGEPPTTSQVPAPVFEQVFRAALDTGLPTVYLSFSSALSGSYDAALLVRDQVLADYPEGELLVVDTGLASIAEGLLALSAIEQRDNGLTASELAAWAEEARWFVNAQFMVDDLASLSRGGRIPSGVAAAGAKLDVKPLLGFALDGSLSMVGMVRGRKKGIKQLVEYFNKRCDRQAASHSMIVADADCPRDSDRLRDEIAKNNPTVMFLESNIGPVIGSHVGPGMVACAFWGDDRRNELGVAERIARRVKERD